MDETNFQKYDNKKVIISDNFILNMIKHPAVKLVVYRSDQWLCRFLDSSDEIKDPYAESKQIPFGPASRCCC